MILFLFLGLQWFALVVYFRVAFNRNFLPLVWKHSRPYGSGTVLIPSTYTVNHSNISRHILREVVGSGYEDLEPYVRQDVDLFSVTRGFSENKQQDMCILMADARPFHDPSKDGIPDITRIDEAQHTWSVKYFEMTPYMNLLYALRHGYSFWRFTLPKALVDGGQRDSTWYKIPLTAYLLRHECRNVFWLDSDAFVRDFEITLEELARAYDIHDGGPYMLVPQDGPGHVNANMGAFLIRNGSEVLDFLEEWWKLPLHDEVFKHKLRGKLHEQDVFNHGMRKYKGTIWVLCPKALLTTTFGSFVRHFWGGHKNETLFLQEMARISMEFVQHLIRSHTDMH